MKKISIFILFIYLVSCNSVEPEAHYLPKGFKGRVIIFFNQKNGTAKKYEGDTRIYEIPQNGVLKTQFDSNEGFVKLTDLNFYYYDNTGLKTPIKYILLNEGDKTDSVNIVAYGTTIGKINDSIDFKEYIIDTYSSIGKYQEIDELKLFNDSK